MIATTFSSEPSPLTNRPPIIESSNCGTCFSVECIVIVVRVDCKSLIQGFITVRSGQDSEVVGNFHHNRKSACNSVVVAWTDPNVPLSVLDYKTPQNN